MGATMTEHGTPASVRPRTASMRFDGVLARGSMARAMCLSSVVTESATFASPRAAMRERMSTSRKTSADLVTMPDRMPGALEHLENSARDAVLALDGLIGIRVGSKRDDLRRVGFAGQLLLQKLRRIGLGVKLGLEVEPRGVAEIAVARGARSNRCSRARSPDRD